MAWNNINRVTTTWNDGVRTGDGWGNQEWGSSYWDGSWTKESTVSDTWNKIERT